MFNETLESEIQNFMLNVPRIALFTTIQVFTNFAEDRVWNNEMIDFVLSSTSIIHNVKFSIITNEDILPIIIKNSFTNATSKCIFLGLIFKFTVLKR